LLQICEIAERVTAEAALLAARLAPRFQQPTPVFPRFLRCRGRGPVTSPPPYPELENSVAFVKENSAHGTKVVVGPPEPLAARVPETAPVERQDPVRGGLRS